MRCKLGVGWLHWGAGSASILSEPPEFVWLLPCICLDMVSHCQVEAHRGPTWGLGGKVWRGEGWHGTQWGVQAWEPVDHLQARPAGERQPLWLHLCFLPVAVVVGDSLARDALVRLAPPARPRAQEGRSHVCSVRPCISSTEDSAWSMKGMQQTCWNRWKD